MSRTSGLPAGTVVRFLVPTNLMLERDEAPADYVTWLFFVPGDTMVVVDSANVVAPSVLLRVLHDGMVHAVRYYVGSPFEENVVPTIDSGKSSTAQRYYDVL